MDIGALLLILGIVVITLAYVLRPLKPQKISDPENLIDYWVDQIHLKPAHENPEGPQYCPNCGAIVKPMDRFCSSCGTKLEGRK